jgi:hypothetical protein
MRQRLLNQFISPILESAIEYDSHAETTEPGDHATSLVMLTEGMVAFLHSGVNYLLGHQRSTLMQTRMLLFLHFLGVCIRDQRLRDLGVDGIFVTSQATVWSAPTNVTAVYARRLRLAQARHGLFLEPAFGLLGEDSKMTTTRPAKKPRRARESGTLDMISTLVHPRPPVYPKNMADIHPSIDQQNGIFVLSPGRTRNEATAMVLGYHQWMYLIKINRGKLTPPAIDDVPARSHCVLDTAVFDWTCPWQLTHVTESYVVVNVVIRRPPPPLKAEHVAISPKPTPPNRIMPATEASALMDFFQPIGSGPVRAIVVGPFALEEWDALTERLRDTTLVKTKFGVAPMSSIVERMVLHSFPTTGVTRLRPRVERHRPALFVVHVPHQNAQLTSLTSFLSFVERTGLVWLHDMVMNRQLGRVLKYMETFCTPEFIDLALDHIYLHLTLSTTEGSKDTMRVSVDGVDISVCIDDLGIGATPEVMAQNSRWIAKVRACIVRDHACGVSSAELDAEMHAAQSLLSRTLRGV